MVVFFVLTYTGELPYLLVMAITPLLMGDKTMTHFYGIKVEVKYHGPTNHRGSRYSATIAEWSDYKLRAYVNYDYSMSHYGNQLEAVVAVAKKFLDENEYYNDFGILAAVDGAFIIEFTNKQEVAA